MVSVGDISVTVNWSAQERQLADELAAGLTIVVNVRKSGPHRKLVPWLAGQKLITYVGHAGQYHDWPGSDFANPFYREASRNRERSIAHYRRWLDEHPELLRRIADGELTGRALGCWCAPLDCHADILAAKVNDGLNLPRAGLRVGSVYEIRSRNLIFAAYLGDGYFKGIREKLGHCGLDVEVLGFTVKRVIREVGRVDLNVSDEMLLSELDAIENRELND